LLEVIVVRSGIFDEEFDTKEEEANGFQSAGDRPNCSRYGL